MRRAIALIALVMALLWQVAPAPAATTPPLESHVSQQQADAPAIWFMPFPPLPILDDRPYVGTEDFMALFEEGSPWSNAASQVRVFQLFPEWLAWTATDDEVARVVQGLAALDIELGVTISVVAPIADCASEEERGYRIEETQRIIERVQAADGTIDYAVLDVPFYYGVYDDEICGLDVETLLEVTAPHVMLLREAFPDIKIGELEPVMGEEMVVAYARYVDRYAELIGTPHEFFHAIADPNLPGWPDVMQKLADAMRGRGIPFGAVYTGDEDATNGADYLAEIQKQVIVLEGIHGLRPDHAVFISWHDQPDNALPETDGATFTNLILRYAAPRPQMEARLVNHPLPSAVRVEGRLLSAAGEPVADAAVTLGAESLLETMIGEPGAEVDATTTDADGYFRFDLWDLPGIGLNFAATYLPDGGWPVFSLLKLGQPSPNVAYQQNVRVSRALDEQPPSNAVDGTDAEWDSGADAPQWIEIDLAAPTPFIGLQMLVSQFPAGETVHRVWAIREDGATFFVHEFNQFTDNDDTLEFAMPLPLMNIVTIRIETLESPSWVSWKEIEVYATEIEGHACVLGPSGVDGADIADAPSHDGAVVYTLGEGELAVVEGRTLGDDGVIWWKLYPEAWVSIYAATTSGYCINLPVVHYEE